MVIKPKVLMYDIETSLLAFWGFRLGEQRVGHNQLLPGYFSRTHIICISYSWDYGKTVKTLTWGKSESDEKDMIIEFDKLIEQADIVIGKNSDRFDNKHINAQRMWHNLPGMPYWTKHTDDLEKQMRKHFDLPSQSLDYISSQLGFGGKDKMSFDDWVAINRLRTVELLDDTHIPCADAVCKMLFGKPIKAVLREGHIAMRKMVVYNKKDVADTGRLWKYLAKHFVPKQNAALIVGTDPAMFACDQCASTALKVLSNKVSGKGYYSYRMCTKCGATSRFPVKKPKK